MNDMPSLGIKGVLPEGYRPSTDIIGFGYIRGTNTSGQILVNSAGEVETWCNQNNTRYFSGSVCFVVEQHSVSQNGDWTIFNFGIGYALSTRKVHKNISATSPFGSLYFVSYNFNAPNIYDSIIYADVNPVTGNGLWIGHYCEIKNITNVRCYLSSATSMSNVGMYVQETVIGKLKQHSVSHDYIVAQGTSGIWFYRKWNSGLAEFWGGKEIKGIGSVTAPAVDFPFPLTSLLYKGASAIYSSGQKGVYVLSGTGASIGLVNTGVYVLNQDVKDNNTTTVAFIEYNVKGMWK